MKANWLVVGRVALLTTEFLGTVTTGWHLYAAQMTFPFFFFSLVCIDKQGRTGYAVMGECILRVNAVIFFSVVASFPFFLYP